MNILRTGGKIIMPPRNQSSLHTMGMCGKRSFGNAGTGKPLVLMTYKVIGGSASHESKKYWGKNCG